MKLYEGFFVFSPSSGPDARTEELKSVEALIARFKGKVTEKKELGKRLLGYEVQKSREAYVVVYQFEMAPADAANLYPAINLEEKILKYMVTVANKPAAPSAKKPVKTYTKTTTAEPAKA